MGLDMYLSKNNGTELGYWRKANAIHGFFTRECGDIENCKDTEISKSCLEKLLSVCKKAVEILDSGNKVSVNREVGFSCEKGKLVPINEDLVGYDAETEEKVKALLPPMQGFFFGSYYIDEGYRQDLLDTIEICENTLREVDWEQEKVYYHAWW